MADVIRKTGSLKVKIENQIYELMPKTLVGQVLQEDGTTLASALASILADIADRPTATVVAADIKKAIDDLINGAPGTYDTLKEIADYIAANDGVIEGINAAIAAKAAQKDLEALEGRVEELEGTSDDLGDLAFKDKVALTDFDTALTEKAAAWDAKVTSVAAGSANGQVKVNGSDITIYTHPTDHAATMITQDATHRFVTDTEKSTWNAKVGAVTSSDNGKIAVDGTPLTVYTHPTAHAATMITQDATHRFVTDTEKATWGAATNVYVQASQPANLKAGDIWFDISE